MKKLWILCAAALSLTACLKEEVRSFNTAENYYRSAAQVESGLNGCYIPLATLMRSRGFWLTTDVCTDVMYINSSTMYEANCDISPAHPSYAATLWSNGYLGVMRCNEMLADIRYSVKSGYLSTSEAAPYQAEAAVMRALYYYLLTATFGDVPYYTARVTEENRAVIATLPRMSAEATRDSCVRDIKTWILERKALPMKRTYEAGYRAGAALGLMVGAKCALWNQNWTDAVVLIDALEDIYGHYADSPDQFGKDYLLTDVPFSHKFTRESIWECANLVEAYGIQVSGVIATISTPSRKEAPTDNASQEESGGEGEEDEGTGKQSDYYDGIAIPELGGFARTSSSARPTAYFYKQLLAYDSPDIRGGEYNGNSSSDLTPRGGSGNLAWRWSGYDLKTDPQRTTRKVLYFNNPGGSTGRPWLGNKFWCFGMYNSKDFNNYRLYRFADALLMKAEAHLGRGENDLACSYLSITRVRAGLNPVNFAGVGGNAQALLEEIRCERARELFGEFQRKYDLVRWGIWYERTRTYSENTYLQTYIRPCHRYWPIPAEQIGYSGNNLSNDEYAQ